MKYNTKSKKPFKCNLSVFLNLLKNEILKIVIFFYLVSKLEARGIMIILNS